MLTGNESVRREMETALERIQRLRPPAERLGEVVDRLRRLLGPRRSAIPSRFHLQRSEVAVWKQSNE